MFDLTDLVFIIRKRWESSKGRIVEIKRITEGEDKMKVGTLNTDIFDCV